MTHTLGARTHEARSTDTARTTGVPEVREARRGPRTMKRGLLIGGMVAGPLFLGVATVQGLVREGFDFTRNAFSQLALGGPGWVQTINFVVTGALLLAGAFGLRRLLRGARARGGCRC